jgi:uncharacterized glyoxalase superfamily protein PhnB
VKRDLNANYGRQSHRQVFVFWKLRIIATGGLKEGNVQIALDFTELAEMARAFQALASGGKVTLPIQDTFWGAEFGMLTDVYGVRWMFNCELKKT